MDAGLAAVCGALAGSVATIGAAFATGRAQREGARIGARVEHRKERRMPRQEAYKRLMSAASEIRSIRKSPVPGESEPQRAYQANKDVKLAWEDIALLGPDDVSRAASELRDLAFALYTLIWALYGTPNVEHERVLYGTANSPEDRQRMRQGYRESLDVLEGKIADAIEEFAEAARTALDDDGSQRRRRWSLRR
ncbi:hypothetical protein OG401_23470 [Kitasatospora purpeofusca]|uniref:hypothetical protein n=1 Tax=Kitasatospora purpeofusca TaxID=67352 RepID=UPI002259BC39|nr:hypothetical protein [Kitasatospora purpeofusca]MCX4687228.1 hypothetical protein [Kitasatospora purpeofusca]